MTSLDPIYTLNWIKYQIKSFFNFVLVPVQFFWCELKSENYYEMFKLKRKPQMWG
jgi:hypothetical protein